MSKIFDLYGFRSWNIDSIAQKLEGVLAAVWVPRDSSFIGEYYSFRSPAESFKLQSNYFEGEEDWQEPDFKEFNTLLYIETDNLARSQALEAALTGHLPGEITLLEREIR